MRDILRAPGIVDAVQRGRAMYEQERNAMSAQQQAELDRQAQEHARSLLASDPLLRSTQQNHDK